MAGSTYTQTSESIAQAQTSSIPNGFMVLSSCDEREGRTCFYSDFVLKEFYYKHKL